MQQCWNCGKVYDESEYAVCPYCNGRFRSHQNHKEMRKALADLSKSKAQSSVRFAMKNNETL